MWESIASRVGSFSIALFTATGACPIGVPLRGSGDQHLCGPIHRDQVMVCATRRVFPAPIAPVLLRRGCSPVRLSPDRAATLRQIARISTLARPYDIWGESMEDVPIAMFKLGEKHMAKLLEWGHVFLRPLLDFRAVENSLPR